MASAAAPAPAVTLPLLTPTWLRRVLEPEVRTVLICGCGGGFDFVHGSLLFDELRAAGKRVVINSYSFIHPNDMLDSATAPQVFPPVVEKHGEKRRVAYAVRQVTAATGCSEIYAPEVQMCAFLDRKYPAEPAHSVYASNARCFTPRLLRDWYEVLVEREQVDSIIIIDGGSDSLMRGDEDGLGDPVEDAVSVSAVATLTHPRVRSRALLSVGFGADRFNGVSDAASLRAIGEVTALGGFLGVSSFDPSYVGLQTYRECAEYIYAHQSFRSVLTGAILSASRGVYGFANPDHTEGRVSSKSVYVWPLMAMLWGIDPLVLYNRSLTCKWIADATDVPDMYTALHAERKKIKILPVEDIPRQTQ